MASSWSGRSLASCVWEGIRIKNPARRNVTGKVHAVFVGDDDSHCSQQFMALKTSLIARFNKQASSKKVIVQRRAHTRRVPLNRLGAGKLG